MMSLLTRATISSTTVSAARGIASKKAAKSGNTESLIEECGFIYFIADYRQAMYQGTASAVPHVVVRKSARPTLERSESGRSAQQENSYRVIVNTTFCRIVPSEPGRCSFFRNFAPIFSSAF